MFDGEAFGKQMVEIVKGHVDRATAPLLARIEELEKREFPLPQKGERGEKGEPGEQGAPGEPGQVDMEEVKALIAGAVGAEIAALPPAERGEKGEPGQDGLPGENGADGAPGADGKDGVGLADAFEDNEGRLVLTMSDGRTKTLGVIRGKDGENGKDGHTFTLDDFDVVPLDERTIRMGFTHGDVMHSFELAIPAVIYRGVWREGEAYQRGDLVTWAGSMWHCDADERAAKPDAGGWTLAVKRGRDGRDAK